MEQTSQGALTVTGPALSGKRGRLLGFRDEPTGLSVGFYRPAHRPDLWNSYVAGVTDVYRRYGVEHALRIPSTEPDSTTPVFAVAIDDDDTIIAGLYLNGPLTAVSEALAPGEFAADPISATLVAEWIVQALPEGVLELKATWVDPDARHKRALADAMARSVVYAMRLLGVTYVFASAADHAARMWMSSGARPLPEISPAPFPDERYSTSFFYWCADAAIGLSSRAQRLQFRRDSYLEAERCAARQETTR